MRVESRVAADPTHTRADLIRARFARLVRASGSCAAEPVVRVGAFTLRPAQREALHAAEAALARFGGVLLADPPGTGKTVLALAIAARAGTNDPATVVAPAALRAQWDDAASRAGARIAFASLESLSRGRRAPTGPLVIVDEAHHLRTPGTRRYAEVAAACARARVVLLTATPVVNRATDRDALLALFLGRRAAELDSVTAARCIVRQREVTTRPRVRRIGEIGRGVELPGLAEALRALPPPLPLTDDRTAAALVAMSLAMAWCSSLAALDGALRRRQQRGEAMRDLLRDGLVPTPAMLRHWTLHEDATQLALGALLAAPDSGSCEGAHERSRARDARPAATSTSRSRALDVLTRHLDAVRAMRAHIRPHRQEDAARRAQALLAVMAEHPRRRIVVFARHAETIRALHAALRHVGGVVAIIGARVQAAAGRWTRDEVLRALGPRARPLDTQDPRAIRLVLATDVVAEGVEMQAVGVVLHADLPWTPARLAQRVGRVTRVGSDSVEVLEGWFAAPRGAREIVRLGRRLRRKVAAGRDALRAARARGAIDALLARWADTDGEPRAGTLAESPPGSLAGPLLARFRASTHGFVAVHQVNDEYRWLAGLRHAGRWRVRSDPDAVLRLLRSIEVSNGARVVASAHRTQAVVARALARRAARALLASDPMRDAGPATAHAIAPRAQRQVERVRARLARLLERAPALARPVLARQHAAWLASLARPLPVARERELGALLRDAPDDASFARRLGSWLAGRAPVNGTSRPGDPGRLVALLELSAARAQAARPRPGQPATSPGSAAPR